MEVPMGEKMYFFGRMRKTRARNERRGPCPSPLKHRGQHIQHCHTYIMYICMKCEKERRSLEYKECLVWSTKLTRGTSLKALMQLCSTSSCRRRENKQQPDAWQDLPGRFLSNLKQQVWKSSQTDQDIPYTMAFSSSN